MLFGMSSISRKLRLATKRLSARISFKPSCVAYVTIVRIQKEGDVYSVDIEKHL